MKKKLAKKLASRKGLTLVELLAAIMILALIGVGMATGMTAATQTYERSVFSSETLVLQDTINTTLGEYLRYASGVVDDSGAVTVAYSRTWPALLRTSTGSTWPLAPTVKLGTAPVQSAGRLLPPVGLAGPPGTLGASVKATVLGVPGLLRLPSPMRR